MPVARYFLYVGGVLLALLFVFDATQPKSPVVTQTEAAAAVVDMPVVRIQSDRKWPEKIVFDTNVPTIVPAPVVQAAAAPAPVAAPAAEMSAKARVRESFAQFADAEHKKPEAQAQPKPKRKVAKHRANPPMMMVAQQRQQFGFGWFGNTW
jgi:predicted component of type VI protein secretion system